MFYYSQAISEFTTKLHRLANHILLAEMKIKALRTRFEFKGYRYPLSFVTFEKPHTLGFFDPYYLQIGIHRHFLFSNDEELLKNVLRHELLHYINHLTHGPSVEAHGVEFRALAKSFDYDKEVYGSSYDNYQGHIVLKEKSEKFLIIEKVKKLLRLSENNQSSHEAQLALAKAKNLLTKHSLNDVTDFDQSETEFIIQVLSEGKRVNSKIQSISQILTHFFVKPIFNHSQSNGYRLEIFGLAHDIEIASYIFDYLNNEMQRLWERAKEQHQLKGLRAKNSFFWGLSEGYISELTKSSVKEGISKSKSLILKDQKLIQNFQNCYQSKRSSRVATKSDSKSTKLGRSIGKKLNINLPLSQKIKGFLS